VYHFDARSRRARRSSRFDAIADETLLIFQLDDLHLVERRAVDRDVVLHTSAFVRLPDLHGGAVSRRESESLRTSAGRALPFDGIGPSVIPHHRTRLQIAKWQIVMRDRPTDRPTDGNGRVDQRGSGAVPQPSTTGRRRYTDGTGAVATGPTADLPSFQRLQTTTGDPRASLAEFFIGKCSNCPRIVDTIDALVPGGPLGPHLTFGGGRDGVGVVEWRALGRVRTRPVHTSLDLIRPGSGCGPQRVSAVVAPRSRRNLVVLGGRTPTDSIGRRRRPPLTLDRFSSRGGRRSAAPSTWSPCRASRVRVLVGQRSGSFAGHRASSSSKYRRHVGETGKVSRAATRERCG